MGYVLIFMQVNACRAHRARAPGRGHAPAPGPSLFHRVFHEAVRVAFVSLADAAEPRASADIAVPFAVSFHVSLYPAEVDIFRRPRSFSFPNADYFASFSSSFELDCKEYVHSAIYGRTSYGLCSILSSQGLRQNKNLEHGHNNPIPDRNNVSDTNDHPRNATTSHSRNRCPRRCQEQRKHQAYRVTLSLPVVQGTGWAAAEEFRYLHLRLPLPS